MTNVYGQGPEQDPRKSKLFTSIHSNRQELIRPEENEKKSSFAEPIISARRQLRQKHSRHRRNVLIVFAIIAGLILALLATDTIKLGTGPKPSFAFSNPTITTTTVKVAGEQIESIRKPTVDNPLKVYIAGDSLTGSYALSLSEKFGNTGLIKPYYDFRPSSGLVNDDFYDWSKQGKKVSDQINPEIVIFMIGTNDASLVSTNKSGYSEKYSDLLEKFTKQFASNTKFFFVLAPSMKETKLNNNIEKLNDVINKFAKRNEFHSIDSGNILSPDDKFVMSINTLDSRVTVRAGDGIHISNAGGEILGELIYKSVISTFKLNRFFTGEEKSIEPVKIKNCCSSNYSTATKSTSKKSTSTSSSSTSSSTPETTEEPDTSAPEDTTD